MSVRIYVGNLPYEVTKEDLKSVFSTIGNVEDAIIISYAGGTKSKGFGFVEMQDEKKAEIAISQLNGYILAGRELKVNIANSRKEDL